MAKHAARTLRPEDEVSHYRIVGPLGAGGMGEVYLAQDQSLERRVALKILPPDLVRSEERVRRFVLEAKSASSLSHPNIVTIYEIGADVVRSQAEPPSDPVHFISMELVSGKTLTTLIHDDRTDLKTLLGFLAQAADGLAKAHAAGIVHRDLKPGNIMVSADGFAKVLDFGLAKLTEKRDAGPEASAAPTVAADATGEGIVVGTAGYMSPEQVQGKAVDARSDIFSFGCILYEAATRRRPFLADTTIETLHKILNEKPAPVEELNPKVPSDLRRLIRRCLAKSPDQRLQSMKDLALELREIVDDYDALSASASSGGSVSGAAAAASAARRGPGAAVIAIASVVVLAAVGFGWWGLQRANQAAKSQPFQTMEMTTVTNRGDVTDCVMSADGRYLAYLAGTPGQVGLRVHQIATGSDVEVLPASSAGLQSPAFSPDGNYIFYLARKPDAQNYRVLYQVPSLGGTPQQRAFDVDSRVTFSPDGKQIAFWRGVTTKHETHLVILDLDSGKERVLGVVTDRELISSSPSWSPDGKQIAVAPLEATGRLRTEVTLFDVASGRRHEQTSLPGTQLRDLVWLKDGSGIAVDGWMNYASINSQIFLIDYPGNRVERVTNDLSEYLGISVSAGNDALAAVRQTFLENVWIADLSGGPARAITSVSNAENSPFGLAAADSGTLVYSAQRDQGVQVFAMSPSGGEPRALTSGSMLSVGTYASAGRALFQRAEPAGIHVWGVNADGSGLRQLTSGAGEEIRSLSPDGRFASVSHFDSVGTAWLLSAESGKERLFASAITGGLGFSPDSRRLMLGHNEPDAAGLVHVKWLAYPVAGGAPTDSLVLSGRSTDAQWNMDGRGVIYVDAGDPARNLYRQDFGASAPVPITRYTEGRITEFAPAPDAKHLAIVRRIGPAENVWVADPDGNHPVQVTQFTSERVFELCWLPDGRRLAIGAGSASRDAVLIRKFR